MGDQQRKNNIERMQAKMHGIGSEIARLLKVKHVLQLELNNYKAPENPKVVEKRMKDYQEQCDAQ